jgi:hypothetical protein
MPKRSASQNTSLYEWSSMPLICGLDLLSALLLLPAALVKRGSCLACLGFSVVRRQVNCFFTVLV